MIDFATSALPSFGAAAIISLAIEGSVFGNASFVVEDITVCVIVVAISDLFAGVVADFNANFFWINFSLFYALNSDTNIFKQKINNES